MNSAENETAPDAVSADVFVESDSAETRFDYDHGGVPIYVGLAWISYIVAMITFVLIYLFPDLASWFGQ